MLPAKGHYVTHHVFQIFYTLFIVAISVGITYFLATKNSRTTSGTISFPTLAFNADLPDNAGTNYVERDSPFDNRNINASSSAQVIFHGPRDKKKIALTFDAEMTDGMKANVISKKVNGSYDPRIIDTLNQTQTPATFFLTGMWIELYPKITDTLSHNPLFELGSHSYSDTSYFGFCYGLQQLSNTVKVEDIGATEKLLHDYTGKENRLFRFPGGCYTPEDVRLVNLANDTVVHWDVKGNDGFNNDTAQIVHNIIDNVQNGSIILLHLNGAPTAPQTAEALPIVIATLKERGYEFVKVSDLLTIK